MQRQSKTFFLLIILFCTNGLFGQTNGVFFETPDSLDKKRFNHSLVAGLGVYATGSTWLWTQWYSQYELGRFQFHNDMGDWAHMDKAGHVYSAYTEASIAYSYIRWTGLSKQKSLLAAVLVGSGVQLTFEIMDGFSNDWGFSIPDVAFNTLGVGVFAFQEKIWNEQRIILKSSNTFSPYPTYTLIGQDGNETNLKERGDELYGSGLGARYLKDYNTMNLWLSVNPTSFIRNKNSRFPKWLNLALGYGAENLYGGVDNNWPADEPNYFLDPTDFPRYSQYYLSFDIDFTRIETNSGFLKAAFKVLNIFKVPSPSLEYNRINGFQFIPLYW
jgi:hypothetical protein